MLQTQYFLLSAFPEALKLIFSGSKVIGDLLF